MTFLRKKRTIKTYDSNESDFRQSCHMKSFFNSPIKILLPILIIGLMIGLAVNLKQKPQAPNAIFRTIDGKQFTMESLRGKMVLVNFWATDCPGCIEEMPELIKTYQTYQDKNFELVAVAMPHDTKSQVVNYATHNALPFPVIHDASGNIAEQFNDVRLTPTAFIIDKEGHIVGKTIGTLNFSALRQLLDAN
jgi:peroxiredoxin